MTRNSGVLPCCSSAPRTRTDMGHRSNCVSAPRRANLGTAGRCVAGECHGSIAISCQAHGADIRRDRARYADQSWYVRKYDRGGAAPGILFYLSGLLALLSGLAIVNLHNTWRADWRVIVTFLGWLMTIGGVIRIAAPQVAIAIGSTIYSGRASTIVAALIVGTLGVFLSFKGYVRHA